MTSSRSNTNGNRVASAGLSKRFVKAVVIWSTRLLAPVISVLLLMSMAALIRAHLDGGDRGLSFTQSYITEYGLSGSHWTWVVIAAFCLALVLFLLATGLLLRLQRSPLVMAGSALIAASSMALFFVSYAPVRRAEQPLSTEHHLMAPQWWITFKTSEGSYEQGVADAYSDVHYRAIRLFVVNALLGMALLGCGLLMSATRKRFAKFTLVSVLVMTILFLATDHIDSWRGLWQRLGFLLMYVWLWGAMSQLNAEDQFERAIED